MTAAQLRTETAAYGKVEQDTAGQWMLRRGNNVVLFTFVGDQLRTIQRKNYHAASTYVDLGPIEDICTGRRSGVLVISGPIELMNAAVYIDGVPAGELTPTATRLVVTLAPHEVRIVKNSWEPISGRITFEQESGFARFDADAKLLVKAR